jgi:RNA polymerase sigma-70 factor (ECF subfamily)
MAGNLIEAELVMTDEVSLPDPSPDTGPPGDRAEFLVEHAIGGDADAMAALYEGHHPAIFHYLWGRTGNRSTAEDLTGDTFVRMVGALPQYRQMGLPFRAWLFRIARNLLVDHYRKSGRVEMRELEEAEAVPAQGAEPGAGMDRQLSLARLQRAMGTLPDAHREVVALRFLSGLSLDETARTLGKSTASVKALQHRALIGLRAALVKEEGE